MTTQEVLITPDAAVEAPSVPVAFLMPGLGDHHRGMGAGLVAAHPVYAETLEHCRAVLQRECGIDISDALKATEHGGPDLRAMLGRARDDSRDIDDAVAQPALFAVEYALVRLWESWGVQPTLMAGYSLGEYVAATVSGVLALDDALRLVGHRAQELTKAPQGSMLAVAADEEVVSALLVDDVWVSGANTPRLTVVAGAPAAVAEVGRRAAERGLTHRSVASSYAFHTPMMEPVAAGLREIAATISTRAPRIPYLSNVTGEPMTEADAHDPGYWGRHLCSPVLWGRTLGGIPADHLVLEVGPGQTLSSMATEVRSGSAPVVASMRHPYQDDADSDVVLRARDLVRAAGTDQGASERAGSTGRAVTELPADTTTETISALWDRLLDLEGPAPLDVPFFDLGGNSLLASRLALRIRREFGTEVTLRQVYEHPTVREQSAMVRGEVVEPGRREVGANLMTLPNGLVVSQQNEAETKHFYEDIFEHRGYVRHGVRIEPGATVVDVGGNIGLFSLFAHTEAPGVRLLTFEPAPPMAEHLRANLARHEVEATVFEMGLADAEGTAELIFYPRSSGMSTLTPDEEEEKRNLRTIIENQERLGNDVSAELAEVSEELLDVRFAGTTYEVPIRRLSDVLREQELDRVDLLKVDVQKAEEAVFDGIDEEHWPLISQIVTEVHDGTTGRVARLTAELERRGFRVTAIQDDLYVGTDIHNLYAIKEQS